MGRLAPKHWTRLLQIFGWYKPSIRIVVFGSARGFLRSGRGVGERKKRENDSLCVIIWVGVAILSSNLCVRYHKTLDGRKNLRHFSIFLGPPTRSEIRAVPKSTIPAGAHGVWSVGWSARFVGGANATAEAHQSRAPLLEGRRALGAHVTNAHKLSLSTYESRSGPLTPISCLATYESPRGGPVLVCLRPEAGPSYRGTSLIRNRPPLGPYSRTMPTVLWWS
ncbi:hypothetical protein T484DRAFT_3025558 [Baffinella frigidus]|nr:hypothetical protein T484DRAFT_3025558 [Cryptophyta sp. CCMP2293]